MKNAIGGYFELELRQGEHYHKDAIKLNTARNCLEYILKARAYKKIYIPYYTCEVILEPIKKLKIKYEFYCVNKSLEPAEEYVLKNNEAFLYTNYFGLKNEAVRKLANKYKNQLIVDNSQAFYAEPQKNTDTFYSARKFFGVPDGAYLYTNKHLEEDFAQDVSFERMNHLLKRIDVNAESAYEDFKMNDMSLSNQPILKMSKLTDGILRSIDYDYVKLRRIENYKLLDEELQNYNQIRLDFEERSVPMVYPYLSNDNNLRSELIGNKIFVAKYWENVYEWCDEKQLEFALSKYMMLLPIDQRFGREEIKHVIHVIKKV